MKVLLQRNNLWTTHVEKYLCEILESCDKCAATSLPKKARNVSLSSLSRDFNQAVCIDHLFLDNFCVFHIMDSKSIYSVGSVVKSTSMENAVEAFEST